MNIRCMTPANRQRLLLAGGLALALAAVLVFLERPVKALTTGEPAPSALSETNPGFDLSDPAPSCEVLRYVARTSGDARTRELAIVWLDNLVHLGERPGPEVETWLMSMIAADGHPDWDTEYRLWLFNSAFNVLHLGRDQAAFTRILHKLALHDEVRTMRLYAVQHLGMQRDGGRLTGGLADEIRASLHDMSFGTEGELAGMAIARLAEWDGGEKPSDPEVLDQAARIAADAALPTDVRVSALHAAAARGLPVARKLAVDAAQPVILRKAAIAVIGIHGGETDFADLERLSGESSRLAQAASPALGSLRARLAGQNAQTLIPF